MVVRGGVRWRVLFNGLKDGNWQKSNCNVRRSAHDGLLAGRNEKKLNGNVCWLSLKNVLKAIIGELDNLFLFLGSLSVLLLSLLGVYVCIQGCLSIFIFTLSVLKFFQLCISNFFLHTIQYIIFFLSSIILYIFLSFSFYFFLLTFSRLNN
jgi:hypothetical protein